MELNIFKNIDTLFVGFLLIEVFVVLFFLYFINKPKNNKYMP